jgi:hypothetical protein
MLRIEPSCYGFAHGDGGDALGYVYIFMLIPCTPPRVAVRFPQQFTLDLFGKVVKDVPTTSEQLSRDGVAKVIRKGSLAGLPFEL